MDSPEIIIIEGGHNSQHVKLNFIINHYPLTRDYTFKKFLIYKFFFHIEEYNVLLGFKHAI